jgi:outer membrane biosynthesis protein TonB
MEFTSANCDVSSQQCRFARVIRTQYSHEHASQARHLKSPLIIQVADHASLEYLCFQHQVTSSTFPHFFIAAPTHCSDHHTLPSYLAMTQSHNTAFPSPPFQDPIRIHIDIDPETLLSATPGPQQPAVPAQPLNISRPQAYPQQQPLPRVQPQSSSQPQSQPQQVVQPNATPAGDPNQAWDTAPEDNADASSTASSSSSTSDTRSSTDTTTDTEDKAEEEFKPMPPIFDAPFRPRQELLQPVPGHPGYFYGPGGTAMYAGGNTPFYGPGGQELTPGKMQANAQLMMQGMGVVPENVGMGGLQMHVWQ